MKPTTVEIADNGCPAGRICVDFGYDPANVGAMRSISGRSYVKTPRKHWHVPLDMNTCRKLRKAFGTDLHIGPGLFDWAKEASRAEAHLGSMALAETAVLARLPRALPTLYRAIHVGPVGLTYTQPGQWAAALAGPGSYQTADVRFLVDAKAPLNANQQSLGKTPEWIAAVWEAGLEQGSHLIVCNSAAVDGTWEPELEKWQADAGESVEIFACTGNRKQRQEVIDAFSESTAVVKWCVVNTQMIQWRKDPDGPHIIRVTGKAAYGPDVCRCTASKTAHLHYASPYPELASHYWDTICIDECHKASVRNEKSITHKAMDALHYVKKRCAMSGTPSKKKGADVWGTLHWLRPDVFTSKWRFAEEYFEIEDNGFGKKILGLRADREEEFFLELTPYVLRRTKAEVLPWIPPKHYVPVWCGMGPAQAKAYRAMLEDGMATLGDDHITTTSILAEYTRLSQFANALCTVRNGKVIPTEESCKLDAMLERMEEADMFDEGSEEKQVVFSTSRQMIELAAAVLRKRLGETKVDIIAGGQNRKGQRRAIKDGFNSGAIRALCIVTTAGGVSLSLTGTTVAHCLDESWAPDEQEQAEDRLHGAGRGIAGEQTTIYIYRTKGTIDEYRMDTAADKAEAQKYIWDVRRKLLKETA